MNNIFVVSAPSGAGKSSLVNAVCELDENIKLSISHTTRPKRLVEIDGVNYHFTDVLTFQQMIIIMNLLSTPKCTIIIMAPINTLLLILQHKDIK